ncbi:PEP-CTERM sorting domain-containing protein [Aliiglaciecola sp. LCG003]|uniref:nidogen-like domain-containing protein n=1 Tax=Aliiglaciecola sp. LCG003 TaxID=3053655 RepID=UPI002572E48F|nr:PEP-CTERM sorting domain-containing protein [Aliiglaciecola sp. LCG003]WJG09065.1 PEP-CTERM sorting domain-containing protein [Aliiglaciecola sp. LCG003]
MSVYGTLYNSVSVNTNGSLNFTYSNDEYDVEDDFEDDYGVSIAAFWSDLDLEENYDARIYQNSGVFGGQDAYIFTWFEVPDYEDNDLLNTFQAIITANGDIQLNFLSIDGVDPDEDPDKGVVGISDGSGSNFDYQTMDIWDFPRSEFSIGYTWDGNDYTRSEWSWSDRVAVSEPSTLMVLSLGLLGFVRIKRNKK